MRYWVCEQPGVFAQHQTEIPKRDSSEVLLKINTIGICGTDLHAYSGNQAYFEYPRILGHELCGEVIEMNEDVTDVKIGDRVVVIPYLNCNNCVACSKGKTNCCQHMKVMGVHVDGGMQEYITVPKANIIPANNLTMNQVVIVEPLAIGAHALHRAELKPGSIILVMGCGPIGIGLIKQAQISGATVIAMDGDQGRLAFAKEIIGCDHVVNVNDEPLSHILQYTNGQLCDAVFDATGNKVALESGIKYMSHGGVFVLVGLSKGSLEYSHPAIHAKEASILCSRNATKEDFIRVMSYLHEFPTESFITHQLSFCDMKDNFESCLNPSSGTMKAVIAL